LWVPLRQCARVGAPRCKPRASAQLTKMSSIDKLMIQGVRSFSPFKHQVTHTPTPSHSLAYRCPFAHSLTDFGEVCGGGFTPSAAVMRRRCVCALQHWNGVDGEGDHTQTRLLACCLARVLATTNMPQFPFPVQHTPATALHLHTIVSEPLCTPTRSNVRGTRTSTRTVNHGRTISQPHVWWYVAWVWWEVDACCREQ